MTGTRDSIRALIGQVDKFPTADQRLRAMGQINQMVLSLFDAEDALTRQMDAEITQRHCFCPEERWERWRDGVIAGPDHEVGTADDVAV